MSTPLPQRKLFTARAKFYLRNTLALPIVGSGIVANAAATLRRATGDSQLAVRSAAVTQGASFLGANGATTRPYVVTASFVSDRRPTRDEWLRAMVEAFLLSYQLQWEQTPGDRIHLTPFDPVIEMRNGADVVVAANAANSTAGIVTYEAATMTEGVPDGYNTSGQDTTITPGGNTPHDGGGSTSGWDQPDAAGGGSTPGGSGGQPQGSGVGWGAIVAGGLVLAVGGYVLLRQPRSNPRRRR